MRHLSPAELIDVADGVRAEISFGHLLQCTACRERLADLRAAMGLAASADVPEPSPLFWDHLSARVRESIAEAAVPRPSLFAFGLGRFSWRVAAPVGAAVAIGVLAMTVTMRPSPDAIGTVVEQRLRDTASAAASQDHAPAAMDPSLVLLTDLAGEMDWQSVVDAGLTMQVGTADDAVAQLTSAERSELQRLLHDAMSGAGV